MKEYWLELEDVKNRMYFIDKEGYEHYRFRHNSNGILDTNEAFFIELVFKPKSFAITPTMRKHRCKAVVTWFDYDERVWKIDDEVIQIDLTAKDIKWFDSIKAVPGDRIKVMCYHYKTPAGITKKSVNFSRTKKSDY